MRYAVLYNPSSRQGGRVAAALRRLPLPSPSARSPSPELDWVALDFRSGDAGMGIDSIAAPDRVIVIGGDGSVNAAFEWLHRLGRSATDCPVGIVPAGTGNNLCRGLSLPLEPAAAFHLALHGERLRRIDALLFSAPGANGQATRLSVQSATLGFATEIAAQYDRLRRRRWLRPILKPLGPQIYRLLAARGLTTLRRPEGLRRATLRLRLELPGGASSDENIVAAFVGNERSLGGKFFPCPGARLDDGKADICYVRADADSFLAVFRAISRGEHLDRPEIAYHQTHGPVQLRLDRPAPLLVDGDVWLSADHFRVEVLPSRFAIVVPEPSAT